jgi:16S rRNA (cytosine1402-N4)-methyltransferase
VNDELQTIEKTLPIAIDMLKSGGRLAVISFHSLEDRIVKQFFKEASTEIIAPPGMASIEEKAAIIKLVTRKPIEPSEAEIAANPRSRSSKLRVVEKL